jgi:cyclic-di-GMP-binding protein
MGKTVVKKYERVGLTMPSFDVISEVDLAEVRNAVENSERELATRFDFRGVEASFEWSGEEAKLTAEGDFQLQQMLDILRTKLVKRGVDADTMEAGAIEHSGKYAIQKISFKQGIDQPTAKKIVKLIKDTKMKVQPSIQADQVRITGKKRDDLQEAIAMLRQADIGQPVQFTNFRD